MFRKKERSIFIFFIFGLINFTSLSGQNFSRFFIDFIRYPEKQVASVTFPLRADNMTIRNGNLYAPVSFSARNNIPVLCADSLNAIENQGQQMVTIVQLDKGTAYNYIFEKYQKSWKLTSYVGVDYRNLPDADFLSFLQRYSRDEDFQMKHTIFPFPSRSYKANKSGENKLLMPREWEMWNFTALFPSLCIFNSNSQAPNRQLYSFKNGKTGLFFNFIKINKKWYLIEMEEYN